MNHLCGDRSAAFARLSRIAVLLCSARVAIACNCLDSSKCPGTSTLAAVEATVATVATVLGGDGGDGGTCGGDGGDGGDTGRS